MTLQSYELLEQSFGEFCGSSNTVAASSGTAALHLAFEVLRHFYPGVESKPFVLVPDYTMVACPRAVSMAGYTPVFVDCNDSLLITAETLNQVTVDLARVSAVMPVHIYGRPCPMPGIIEYSLRNDIQVIEDMSEAPTTKHWSGSFAACWSFYKNKIICGDEGGLVAFREKDHADYARSLRSLGFTEAHNFMHNPRGHNYRLSNVHADSILQSFHSLPCNLERRKVIADIYTRNLSRWAFGSPRESNWVHDLRIPGMTYTMQTGVVSYLNALGIAARHGFRPMSSQPEYQVIATSDVTSLCPSPNAYRLAPEVFYLPVSGVSEEMAEDIAVTLINHLESVGYQS